MDSLQVTEDASAAVASAPRISKLFIEGQIAQKMFFIGQDAGIVAMSDISTHSPRVSLAHLTICLLTTHSGFTVVGKSAPMDPMNYNRDLGIQLAYEDAFRQLWPLYAFSNMEHGLRGSQEAGEATGEDVGAIAGHVLAASDAMLVHFAANHPQKLKALAGSALTQRPDH